MHRSKVFRARIEASLAAMTGVLWILTFFWRDWIEGLTAWNPDHHGGGFEVGLSSVLLLVSVTCALTARRTYHRLAALSS